MYLYRCPDLTTSNWCSTLTVKDAYKDHMQEGDITIKYVGMTNNVVDILMKPLKGGETTQLAQAMGLVILARGGELKLHWNDKHAGELNHQQAKDHACIVNSVATNQDMFRERNAETKEENAEACHNTPSSQGVNSQSHE
ncbi:hypothetical protein NDA11_003356 [Ustilago hordei]|uniref:Uncharacterized protein n=1 Tax=Ustilago hordei TaxID=120017 RepID=I2G0C1_USTHO|nr:hypothetical protein NDA10_005335 [Ustilago hordei]KAJ1578936.1 hypothetical protein NDA15_002648 [Ustilago hordei]KAJ1580803.1 hypothetical protein NDA12_006871 [Ustilago hordei]KAJ1581440.1 hypothetical protein NDA11_003356 [Ustilago hordei]KAJ1594939.1 hypothetical protein NDA14_003292 [Ustilago hordei]